MMLVFMAVLHFVLTKQLSVPKINYGEISVWTLDQLKAPCLRFIRASKKKVRHLFYSDVLLDVALLFVLAVIT